MKKDCVICSGKGRVQTQPFGVLHKCQSCAGSGKKMNLGELQEYQSDLYRLNKKYGITG